MRYFLALFFVLSIFSFCYADRVCIEKSTGKLIEYQSGDAQLETLTNNAISAGYKKEDVEEKYVTKKEWSKIKEEQLDKPAREKQEKKEQERKQKEDKIKTKLGLSDKDFNDLKEALKD